MSFTVSVEFYCSLTKAYDDNDDDDDDDDDDDRNCFQTHKIHFGNITHAVILSRLSIDIAELYKLSQP